MIIGIHQPNFFPWFGYFVKITRSDMFVFLDDVQIVQTGGSYTNRTLLNIQGTAKYFSVPIKRDPGIQLINQTIFASKIWQKKLKATIQINYSKTQYYKKTIDLIHHIIEYDTDLLAEFNINAITSLTDYIGIRNSFVKSSTLQVSSSSTERLVEIIKLLNGDTYLSGKGADNYQQVSLFSNNQINILYNDFEHPVYKQNNSTHFLSGLSILDFLFILGKDHVQELLLNLRF